MKAEHAFLIVFVCGALGIFLGASAVACFTDPALTCEPPVAQTPEAAAPEADAPVSDAPADGPIVDAAVCPVCPAPSLPDASAGYGRWGSIFEECDLKATCSESIWCESLLRRDAGMEPRHGVSCKCGDAPCVGPDASVGPGRWGSLVDQCNMVSTCSESVVCENRFRATTACQRTTYAH